MGVIAFVSDNWNDLVHTTGSLVIGILESLPALLIGFFYGSLWAFHGAAFEAFDLPWKAAESKLAVEKSWGVFSAKREPYPALAVWRAAAGGG